VRCIAITSGLDSSGLDLSRTQAHYTVMDKGLSDPCADRNMVAVSNPSRIDPTLTDRNNRIIVHAYGAGCESYEPWRKYETSEAKSYDSLEYQQAKIEGSAYLYRSVSKALGLSIDEIKSRSEVALIGSPLTHKRYLNRFEGTYGPTFRDTLQGPLTPIEGLYLTGDSTFPGTRILL
jgi:phytoene dehydrogenase-like protein